MAALRPAGPETRMSIRVEWVAAIEAPSISRERLYRAWQRALKTGDSGGAISVEDGRQRFKSAPQRLAPLGGNTAKLLVFRIDAPAHPEIEVVLGDHGEVQRHADRKIGPQRGIHRDAHR